MAKGTTPLYWVGNYDLTSSNGWSLRTGNIAGTSNSGAKKQVLVYKFNAPKTYSSNTVSTISKIGFYTCKRTDGVYANNETIGHGMYEGSSASLRFLVKSTSTLTWADLSNGIGKFNLGNMNDGSQAPMTSSTEGKFSGDTPSPTQYTPNITITPGNTYYIFIFVISIFFIVSV